MTFSSIAWNLCRHAAHRGGRFSRAAYGLSTIYVRAYRNLNYDMATNGELFVLDCFSKQNIRTIFDVGANLGEYVMHCMPRFGGATIHAFEVVPDTFAKLQASVGHIPNVRINNVGLSDSDRTTEINYNPEHDGASSLIANVDSIHPHLSWSKRVVRLTTGDSYLRQNDIAAVDLLKIDVEGAEHLVLAGFEDTLRRGAISSIQFEYGMANIYSKFLLHDFWSLLTGYGFQIGPIMPKGVAFRPYDPRDEDFQGPPNFLAVHRSRPELAAAVALG